MAFGRASSHPIVRSPLPGWRGADVIDLMAGRSQGGSMHRKLIALAAAVSMVLLVSGVAAASITLFEEPLFDLGSVNGQSGVGGFPWKSAPLGAIPACVPTPTNGQYDQAVVANSVAPPGDPPGFGSQSLRMSNACASSEFFNQTYSPQELQQVGEQRPNKVFLAEFAFIPTTPAYQPGLFISVSPDSGEGSRMSWVGLQDTAEGIQVSVNDTPDVDGEFVAHPGPLLDRTSPHRIRFWIKVNQGIDNDLVRISVDGVDLGQCFTTWENYYRTAPEQAPPPNRNTPATINSLQFRTSVPGPPALAGNGYLFDNVSITPSNGPGPPGCDVPIEKTADSPTVTAGGRAGYQITVRNRGRLAARNLRACDRLPRRMTFVSADRRLRRIGRQRCLTIPRLRPGQRVSFHLVLQVDADAPQGRVTNTGDVTPPPVTPPSSAGLGSPASPGGPPAVIATPKPIATPNPIARAKAVVKIVKRAQAQRGRPRARPPFTG
jgi:uncharacterized repeat protein (TIGR01451 family)